MRLRLDLAHPEPRPGRLGWTLLVLGLAAALWAGWRYQGEAQKLDGARARVAALEPARPRAQRPAGGRESALAVGARKALGADWPGLLARLEAGRPRQIALLALEADGAQGELRLEANARDLAAMLAWLETLEGAGLGPVRLVSHTAMEEEGQGSVRQTYVHFVAQGRWGGARGRP